MSTSQDHSVTWKNVPTRTITAGGVEFVSRTRQRQPWHAGGLPRPSRGRDGQLGAPESIDGFAAKHRVVVFDNRGVGASSGSPASSMEQMAKDAITFIKAMGFEQVDLFGFSMGGMIAQEIVLMEPQLVRKVIITGTGPAGGVGISNVIPCLSPTATATAWFRSSNTYDLAQRLPNSELIIYPDSGHGAVFQFHADFVPKALEFLARQQRPETTDGQT